MAKKQIGVVLSWHSRLNIGTVIDRGFDPPKRYFLHGARVISGPEPTVGAAVRFEVEPRKSPVPADRLPAIIKIEVLDGGAR